MLYHVHGFVDGAYLRRLAQQANVPLVDPYKLIKNVVWDEQVQTWGGGPKDLVTTTLTRVIYYDARPDDASDVSQELKDYWDAVEALPDTELGFGSLRGGTKKSPPRQKGVDTLIAVDMLVGSFTKIFSIAVLVAGDADFVPVVNEVKRHGVMVVVAASEKNASADLKAAGDRFIAIGPTEERGKFPVLEIDGRKWPATYSSFDLCVQGK